MLRACLLALLLTSTFAFTIAAPSCRTQIMSAVSSLQNALTQRDPNAMIDRIADTVLLVPGMLETCVGKQAAINFDKQVSKQCVNDLDKAAKLGVKILNETDNDFKTARDVALLEHLIQTKVKKDCPFLHDLSLNDIKSGGVCLESAYRLSLVFQKLQEDANKGDKQAAIKDIDTIITNLPDTLDACGQADWAQKVRKYLPMPCVHSIEAFVQELGVAEHNYEHLEWLVKHYKQIVAAFGDVRANCPLLH